MAGSSKPAPEAVVKDGCVMRPSLKPTQILVPPAKSIASESSLTSLTYISQSPAWQCTFSRNGEWLAACFGAPDPCIRVWKQQPMTTQTQAPLPPPTGSTIPAFETTTTKNKSNWVLHATLDHVHERTIRSIAFAPIQSPLILAAASFDGSVSIWEYVEGGEWECTTQLEGHENEVKSVTWNSTGSLLASCGRDKSVWLWESFLPGTIGGPSGSSGGGGGGGDFECIAVLNGHDGDVKAVQFAPSHGQWGDGDEILLSASYDETIKVWVEDAGDWYCAVTIKDVHSDTIWCLAVSPGGGRLLSGSTDGSIAIFKSYTENEKKALFPNEESTSGGNGLWKCVGKLPDAHSNTVYSIHCAPARAGHGRIASSGGDNRIQIYRESLGSSSDKPLFSLDAVAETTHGDVNCVCWHPWDGSILCSAGDDGTVRIWDYQLSLSP